MRIHKALAVLGLMAFPLALFLGCASSHPALEQAVKVMPNERPQPVDYVIQPGDELDIKFFFNPELNETVTVRPDGKVSLQLVDELRAAGRTPAQLDAFLTEAYSKELKKPIVTVIVKSFKGHRVYVGGEVEAPGLVDLNAQMTALQSVISAGGFLETADPASAIVIRKGQDNQPLPIRVNLANFYPQQGPGVGFQLHPYDIVYIPKSPIAKANKFVNQYIEKLLLFRGVSFGFAYQVNDINYRD